MKISWKLGLLVFVICSIALVPALDSAVGKQVKTVLTPTNTQSLAITADGQNTAVVFNTAGTKMFLMGDENNTVDEYACSSAFLVDTCSYSGDAADFDNSAQEADGRDIAFNTDGTKMFVVGADGTIDEYACTTGFDVSTCSFTDATATTGETTPQGIAFNTAGTKVFIAGDQGNDITEYTLGAGFDASNSLTAIDSFSVASQETDPEDVAFSTDGTKMFVIGSDSDKIHEYSCAAFDVSTCVFVDSANIKGQATDPQSLTWNADGSKFFVTGIDVDKVHEFSLDPRCTWDVSCILDTVDTADGAEEDERRALLSPWLTEGILLDLKPSDRTVDTTASVPHVQLEPGDTITITLNVQDDQGPGDIKQVSMYTNYGDTPSDMNLYYANNFNDKNEISQSFYHWYQNNDDVAYGYDDTIQWKYVSGYTTNADYSELTKDRISISVGDLIHEASTSQDERLVVSFTATFNEMMSKSNIQVKLADYDGLYNIVTLPFTVQVGTPDATFEDVMGKHPGYKFIPMLDASQTLESIQQWIEPSSEMTNEQFTQLLGIQETELPAWVKDNLAQWVVEDKIDIAVMIIAIEHLINLQ